MTFLGLHRAAAVDYSGVYAQGILSELFIGCYFIFFGKVPKRVSCPTPWAIVAEEKEGGCLE